MATDGDVTVTKCRQCNGQPIAPYVERKAVRVQVNGPGGVFETATLAAGDTVEIAFRKNGGAWGILPRQYEIKNGATAPNMLIMYATFLISEENRGGDQG